MLQTLLSQCFRRFSTPPRVHRESSSRPACYLAIKACVRVSETCGRIWRHGAVGSQELFHRMPIVLLVDAILRCTLDAKMPIYAARTALHYIVVRHPCVERVNALPASSSSSSHARAERCRDVTSDAPFLLMFFLSVWRASPCFVILPFAPSSIALADALCCSRLHVV
eukprot:6203744-Pleurochrysis_carterae.AAC.1